MYLNFIETQLIDLDTKANIIEQIKHVFQVKMFIMVAYFYSIHARCFMPKIRKCKSIYKLIDIRHNNVKMNFIYVVYRVKLHINKSTK